MRSLTTLLLLCVCCFAYAQKATKKTFLISSIGNNPLLYNQISTVDINSGKTSENVFDNNRKYSSRNNTYRSYDKQEDNDDDNDKDDSKKPLTSSVACIAYDAKSERLFYVPLNFSELRFMDLKESTPCFTYLRNQSLNLMHHKDDVANQITRMTIGKDGFGYALSNDGEHLIKFTTQGTPVIQDLGVLIDNPSNQVLVRSSCTSWGGDIVAAADGSLYLVTIRNHVFKISLPSKKCDYIGMIKNLPAEYTSNGVSADENGEMIVSCGTSIGKSFSPLYKVKFPSLEASPVGQKINGIGNISDLASSNLLFQKSDKDDDEKKKVKSTAEVFFVQSEATKEENNLPDFTIFPNPVTRGKFQVRSSNIKEKGEYRMLLLDVNGKAVVEGRMNLGLKTNINSFNFPSQYAKGIYFVQIADIYNRTVYSQQLIVE